MSFPVRVKIVAAAEGHCERPKAKAQITAAGSSRGGSMWRRAPYVQTQHS
jgi:hypothetical protein